MKRTLEEQLYNELTQDYGFPRAICRSLTELFYSYPNLYLGADRSDGQLIYRAVPADVPPGVKTGEIKIHPVRLTISCMEDIRYASKDITRYFHPNNTNQNAFSMMSSNLSSKY